MTTPARKLLAKLHLITAPTIEVRRTDGRLDSRVSITEAMALCIRGVVEGVGPPSGSIRFLRYLTRETVEAFDEDSDAVFTSRSGPIARTNLGVYEQELLCDTGAVAHCWAFCMLRSAGL